MTLGEIIKEIDSGNRIVVHCDTEEKAIELLTVCKDKGYRWNGGDELIGRLDCHNGHWNDYKYNTVYYINDSRKGYISYSSVEYCKEIGILFVYYKTEETPLIKSEYDISFLFD